MRRRRGKDDTDQDVNQHARRDAHGRRAAYQSDALARAPHPAYEEYEFVEEYEDHSPSPPSPAPGQPRSTVVMPAVTLPSVPAIPTPQSYAQPRRSSAGWRRTAGPDLTHDPNEDDDSWLNDKSATSKRSRVRKAQRGAGSHAAAAAPDPRNAGWDQLPGEDELSPYAGDVAARTSHAPRTPTTVGRRPSASRPRRCPLEVCGA